jgi:hypothetical protein
MFKPNTGSAYLLAPALSDQADKSHCGKDQSKAHIEDRKPVQMLKALSREKIPVDPITPLEREQIIDQKHQLQLSEKKRLGA